ncbi:speriolin-like protein [Bombina bombina]|uniref:speriolin-like protein n=1 Tax=Bombina bombina TaxID=8345 RepID=UPI00235A96EA|nr:speriolin-like protein [Bombina bombina]
MNLLHSQELESLRKENVRLLNENGELRKMVVLMQENLELRCTLRDHESRVRTLSPPAAGYKDDKDKGRLSLVGISLNVKEPLSEAASSGGQISVEFLAFGNSFKDRSMDVHSHDVEALRKANAHLVTENGELRNMVGLMQENIQLHCTLRDQESHMSTLSAPQTGFKNLKDKGLIDQESKDKKDDLTEKPHIPQQEDNEHLQHCHQVLGEIAFQLDRRILSYIFLEQSRIYGFTVSNALEKIMQASTCPLTNNVNEVQRAEMMARYTDIMNRLKKLGYDTRVHPMVSEHLVNSYGILKKHPEPLTKEWESYNDPEVLYKIATDAAPSDSVKHVQVLLNCLVNLAKEDGKSLFIW